MATKKHKFQTNFSGGVLSENAFGRIDTTLYNNGLKKGENIIIENPGGATRRPGTLFVKEFEEDYVRLLPFTFNTQQVYLLVFTELRVDMFRDDALVASVVTPYTAEQVAELDFAQSADSMVLTHGDHSVQVLRRLATDADWELIPVPFESQPVELRCEDGLRPEPGGTCSDASEPTEQAVWGELNGFPKYCTFFQGRLYLAACNLLPQNVWGSVVHDFFNFAIGTGEDADAIYDILDTDFMNPIVAIYAEKALYVFSTGDEFVNSAAVITPAASSWQRASKYGSFGTVRPVAFDAGIVYLDRSGRTIRQMIFEDSIKSFDSTAISMYSESLIKAPVNMGIMKGRLFQASNFLFMVNVDGTMAVLNLSRAVGMAAWAKWTTQGFFKDILTFNNEITYVLVERRGKWILEKLEDGIYVDSGAVATTTAAVIIPDPVTYLDIDIVIDVTYLGATVTYGFKEVDADSVDVIGDRNNFFGVNFNKRGYGKIVIVLEGQTIYKSEEFVQDPIQSKNIRDIVYKPVNKFAYDEDLADLYFGETQQTEFYLYSMLVVGETDASQSFIDGLPHLIGREVVMNLDGSAFSEQTVVPGDQVPGGGFIKFYPDTAAWLFDETEGSETYLLRYVDQDLVTTLIEGYYKGTKYGPLTENEFWGAFPITQSGTPVADDEFLEEGVFVNEIVEGDISYTHKDDGASLTFTVPDKVTELEVTVLAGGGSGASNKERATGGDNEAGYAGEIKKKKLEVTPGEIVSIVIGAGGTAVACGSSNYQVGNDGSDTIVTTQAETLTAIGGSGGSNKPYPEVGFFGNGEEVETILGIASNGIKASYPALVGVGYSMGGESSGLENGGNGAYNTAAQAGGIGSGGGSVQGNSNCQASGAGGGGKVAISWFKSLRYYRIRKMQLKTAELPSTDGVVQTPRTFAIGQAGLWFGVDMETLPYNASSLTNEPKRVVSIMPRFVNTAGLNIANNEVPERKFGKEVLDQPLPHKTGIQKIRLLGYTRETTIRITQHDPLPMTLVSIDIEIKIG